TVNFSDGISWTMTQIKQMLLDEASAANGGTVYGYASNDVIVAGPGDKNLYGEGGYDTYVYSSGGGNDVIDDGYGLVSKLVFSDIASTDVTLAQQSTNLVITNTLTGKTVTVVNELNPYKTGSLQSINFDDGVSWTPDQAAELLVAPATPTGIFRAEPE